MTDTVETVIARAILAAPIDGDCELHEFLDFNALDASALGIILTEKDAAGKPRWHWYSDIACDEQDDTKAEISRRAATHVIAALDAAGYAIVPKEPTEAMLNATAGMDIYWNYRSDGEPGSVEDVYRAMLAAARESPAPKQQE